MSFSNWNHKREATKKRIVARYYVPKMPPVAIEVVERTTGQMAHRRQLPDVLSFTCAQPLQFNPHFPAKICDDNGDFYNFIPQSIAGKVHSGYIQPIPFDDHVV